MTSNVLCTLCNSPSGPQVLQKTLLGRKEIEQHKTWWNSAEKNGLTDRKWKLRRTWEFNRARKRSQNSSKWTWHPPHQPPSPAEINVAIGRNARLSTICEKRGQKTFFLKYTRKGDFRNQKYVWWYLERTLQEAVCSYAQIHKHIYDVSVTSPCKVPVSYCGSKCANVKKCWDF